MKTNKQKKSVTALLLVLIALTAILLGTGIGTVVAEELDYNEADMIFLETVKEMRGECAIDATREVLFDVNLDTVGYVYDFIAGGTVGYAIATNCDGVWDVSEISFDGENPYAGITDTRVYYSALNYGFSRNNDFYSLSGREIPQTELDAAAPYLAYSGSNLEYAGESVHYASRFVKKNTFNNYFPACTSSNENDCLAVAGANIIIYFDRFFEDLIPNYYPMTGTVEDFSIVYKPQDATQNNLIAQLRSDMGLSTAGASVNGFLNGIKNYVNRANGRYIINSAMRNGSFDYTTVELSVIGFTPSVIIATSFFLASSINTESGSNGVDIVSGYLGTSYIHAFTVYGYRIVEYTFSNGTERHDKYFHVATGFPEIPRAYIRTNTSSIIDAYTVDIGTK